MLAQDVVRLALINRAPSVADGSDHIIRTNTTGSSSWEGVISVFVGLGVERAVDADKSALGTKEGG